MRARTYGNLPSELDAFVGRGPELAALERLLGTARLVTVTGVGGVGKSRLALRAARAVQERSCTAPPTPAAPSPEAPRPPAVEVRFADLSEVTGAPGGGPEPVARALAEALDLTDHTTRPAPDVLAGALADRELLLLLDGFEQVVDACADLVRELLRRCPGLRVLAAGRRPLHLAGEHLLPLEPLPPAEALELLTIRASAAGRPGPGADGPADRGPALTELCARLEGIPLALELAAGRLRTLPAEQLLVRLEDRFRLLSGGVRGAPPRHRALRTTIGWSHELCGPAERLLWARLSVFAGRFDLEAAEYVCAGPDLPPEEVLDLVGELVAQSLLVREDGPAGPRYRMLDTVREYGAEWLRALGDAVRLRRRHRDWYTGLATWCELEWFSPRQAEVAALVAVELPNLRLALEYCLEEPEEAHLGQYLAGTLWFAWAGCGRLAEGRHWLDRALESAPEGTHAGSRLKALWVLGYVACLQGDQVAALAALHECREGAGPADSPVAAAYAEHRLGCLALVSDDPERAAGLLGSALERYRAAGELNSSVLMCQVELALATAFRGDLRGAVRLCEEVREVCEERGERWTRSYALYVLAHAALGRGEPAAARELLAECVRSAYLFQDLLGLVLALELLALVTVEQGDAAEAAVLQGAAEVLWRSVGLRLFGSDHFNGARLACLRRAGEALGPAGYRLRAAEGAVLRLEEVVARALRPAGRNGALLPGPRPGAPERTAPERRKPAGSPYGEPTG